VRDHKGTSEIVKSDSLVEQVAQIEDFSSRKIEKQAFLDGMSLGSFSGVSNQGHSSAWAVRPSRGN
jgi:hypothetical protein